MLIFKNEDIVNFIFLGLMILILYKQSQGLNQIIKHLINCKYLSPQKANK